MTILKKVSALSDISSLLKGKSRLNQRKKSKNDWEGHPMPRMQSFTAISLNMLIQTSAELLITAMKRKNTKH